MRVYAMPVAPTSNYNLRRTERYTRGARLQQEFVQVIRGEVRNALRFEHIIHASATREDVGLVEVESV